MNSPKMRRALLLFFSILVAGSLAFYPIANWAIQSEIKSYQEARNSLVGWTVLKQYAQCNGIFLDSLGKLWVDVNQPRFCRGPHVFDGAKWSEDSNLPNITDNIDHEGKIWLIDDGLYVSDGVSSQEVLYEGEKIRNITEIAFDKQNHLWVVNQCGNIGQYDGSVWKTLLIEPGGLGMNHEPVDCGDDKRSNYQIYVDDRGRVWVWHREEIRVFENGTWTILTTQNTGINGDEDVYTPFGRFINDLVVDEFDRVWILSARGLSMISVNDIQVIPQEIVARWRLARFWLDVLHSDFPFLLPLEIIYLWILIVVNMNVWKKNLINDIEAESARKIRRLAKSSLVLGNISGGIMCLLLLVSMLIAIAQIIEGDNWVIVHFMMYIAGAMLIFPLSIASLISARTAIKKITNEGGDSDGINRKMAKGGALFGVLTIIIFLIYFIRILLK